MDVAVRLDPVEVLAHLKEMGYHNITPHQLKEFIKDLKKLIAFDQLSSSSESLTSLSSNFSDSEYYSASETPTDQSSIRNDTPDHSHHPKQSKELYSSRLSENSTSWTSHQSTHTSCSSASSVTKSVGKENRPFLGTDKKTRSLSSESLTVQTKSFIRPWQLQSGATGPKRVGRSDPVKLYQYYKKLWAQRKCPGEDSHADLRWVIRERMLGQDPHLHATSYRALNGMKTNRLRM